jgi:prolyl-tRNA synthetase
MGVIAEKFADDKGLVWPEAIAPFRVYLARLGEDEKVAQQADELYERLTTLGVQVLYDDRDARAGEKFADADLMGIPYRVVISDKTVAAEAVELKSRQAEQAEQISEAQLFKTIGL